VSVGVAVGVMESVEVPELLEESEPLPDTVVVAEGVEVPVMLEESEPLPDTVVVTDGVEVPELLVEVEPELLSETVGVIEDVEEGESDAVIEEV
jgi:hypothetical protein